VEEMISGGNPEIAPNLIYLGELLRKETTTADATGKSNVLTTPQGLKIAAVGGIYDANQYDSDNQVCLSQQYK